MSAYAAYGLNLTQTGRERKTLSDASLTYFEQLAITTAAQAIESFTNQTGVSNPNSAATSIVIDLTDIPTPDPRLTYITKWTSQLTNAGFVVGYIAPNLTVSCPP